MIREKIFTQRESTVMAKALFNFFPEKPKKVVQTSEQSIVGECAVCGKRVTKFKWDNETNYCTKCGKRYEWRGIQVERMADAI